MAMIIDESSIMNDWKYMFDVYCRYMDTRSYETDRDEYKKSYPWICLNREYDDMLDDFMIRCNTELYYQYNFPKASNEEILILFDAFRPVGKIVMQYIDLLECRLDINERLLKIAISRLKNYELLIKAPIKTVCWYYRNWCYNCQGKELNAISCKKCHKCHKCRWCTWKFTHTTSICTCDNNYHYYWKRSNISDDEWINRKSEEILGSLKIWCIGDSAY
jgi:hypothetical protein